MKEFGRAEGRADGVKEGEEIAFFKLVSQGLLPAQVAADQLKLTIEAFTAKMNEYLNSTQSI